jgi:hypothetical protein
MQIGEIKASCAKTSGGSAARSRRQHGFGSFLGLKHVTTHQAQQRHLLGPDRRDEINAD